MNRTNRRNTDTSNANSQRVKNADEFALMIVQKLDKIQSENNYEFKGLNDRVVALNHMGIRTRRGSKWSNNSVKRVLERVVSLTNL
jgi:hypothetical protein